MSATVVAQLRSLHGRDLHSPAAQKCAESLRERRHKRTFEVDLSVQAHQELNRCNPRVFGRQVSCFEHIFVRQVFNRMSKNFERMPSLSTDSPIPSQARFALQHPGVARIPTPIAVAIRLRLLPGIPYRRVSSISLIFRSRQGLNRSSVKPSLHPVILLTDAKSGNNVYTAE